MEEEMKITGIKIFGFIFLMLFFTDATAIAGPTYLAVASEGQGSDAKICQQAARAPYFLFFDVLS